eukprot:9781763-Ditylum_brightwellii.AAC.1
MASNPTGGVPSSGLAGGEIFFFKRFVELTDGEMLATLGGGDFPFGEDCFPCFLGVEDNPEGCPTAAFFVFVLLGISSDTYWGRTYTNREESQKVPKTD